MKFIRSDKNSSFFHPMSSMVRKVLVCWNKKKNSIITIHTMIMHVLWLKMDSHIELTAIGMCTLFHMNAKTGEFTVFPCYRNMSLNNGASVLETANNIQAPMNDGASTHRIQITTLFQVPRLICHLIIYIWMSGLTLNYLWRWWN